MIPILWTLVSMLMIDSLDICITGKSNDTDSRNFGIAANGTGSLDFDISQLVNSFRGSFC